MPLKNNEIAERYISLFAVKNQTELADRLGITPAAVSDWKNGRRAVPWEKLIQAVEESGVTWDWLLTGQGGRESNFNQKPGISFDKGGADDLAYGEKGDMMDSTGVEFLKDHLSTLKQDKADLLEKVAVLEKELAELREENKRLLTLSSARDTRQAGSA